jgi:sec-independent protein translocase protein TatA
MFGNLNGWHLIIVLAIVLLLFGAPKLPGLARSVAESMRIFRHEVKSKNDAVPDEGDLEDARSTALNAPKA